MKPIPPCYDSVNEQDCPDRKLGCHAKCKKWRLYEKYRNRDYHDRHIDTNACITEGHRRKCIQELKRTNKWSNTDRD